MMSFLLVMSSVVSTIGLFLLTAFASYLQYDYTYVFFIGFVAMLIVTIVDGNRASFQPLRELSFADIFSFLCLIAMRLAYAYMFVILGFIIATDMSYVLVTIPAQILIFTGLLYVGE